MIAGSCPAVSNGFRRSCGSSQWSSLRRSCSGIALGDPAESIENTLWGAPRVHDQLFKPGFEVAQSRVAKYRERSFETPGDDQHAAMDSSSRT